MSYRMGDRNQQTFFPPSVEDYVSPEDPVRVYDAFIEALDFKKLGIKINHEQKGCQQYHPKQMLKLIVYGYSYRVRTSRLLERACHHNISFIWVISSQITEQSQDLGQPM